MSWTTPWRRSRLTDEQWSNRKKPLVHQRPSKIHSALPSENFTYFLWRCIPGEISEPEPTAKCFLENVSQWPVQHDPTRLCFKDGELKSCCFFAVHLSMPWRHKWMEVLQLQFSLMERHVGSKDHEFRIFYPCIKFENQQVRLTCRMGGHTFCDNVRRLMC